MSQSSVPLYSASLHYEPIYARVHTHMYKKISPSLSLSLSLSIYIWLWEICLIGKSFPRS